MDIQSSVLDAIFVLYPVHVPGWITPVEPAGIAHGGIPLALYDGSPKGLQCVIDPWTELLQRSVTLAAYDSVALYVQGKTRPVDSATVQPGEESKRIALYVPHGMLVEGVNHLYYVVTRLSGNDETSRVLNVLYYQSAPYNHNLLIPPDVIANGVSAERAAQGVTFTFTYTKPRSFDTVYFRIGSRTFTYEVTDPAAPLSITLHTDDFKAIGDGLAQANFTVTDQLTNNGMSANKTVDIQLGRVEPLLAPKILEAGGNTLVPENAVQTLRGQIDISKLAPTGTLTLSWIAAAGLPAQASFTSAAIPVGTGATRDIPIPVAMVAYSIGKTVTVRYVYTPPGGAALPSPDLTLSISPLSRLSQPWIVQADNSGQGPVLDIGKLTANPECRMGVWDHIADRQPVWLTLKGTNSDGTSYEKRLWNVPGAAVNTTWIAQGSYPQGWALAEAQRLLDGSSLTVTFKAALDMNPSEALATVFPVRTYTVRTVALIVPTLTSVTDANGQEVPENGFTTSTTLTLKGKASKGLQVEIYDGSGPSAVSKGTATANASTGDWQLNITVPVGPRRLYAKSLYHPSATYSNVRLLTVQVALTAPTVREAPNNASLAPLAAKDSLTAIVNYPMQAGDKISVTWKGVAGEGSHTTALIDAGAQPQPIPLPNSVVAFNLNKTVTITYTVTRGGVALPTSPALTLSVLPLPDIALPKPRIPQAANNGEGPELNVGSLLTFQLLMNSWSLIADRQYVWLRLKGTNANGSAFNNTYWAAPSAYVNPAWVANGFYAQSIPASNLMGLKDGSALTMEFKAALNKSQNEAEAVTFPLRTYTVRTVALVAPVISGVKDAAGWDIPDNGYSVRDSVTISGTAPAGQQVEIFDGNVSKGKVTATGGTWSITLNGLALNVLHSITAVGQYGSNPRSNVWRFTSVQGQVPAITRANDSKGTAIANGGSTSDSTITLTGTANALLRVEIFDNGVSTGKTVAANAQGVWELVLTGLGIATHAFTAKALYGSGTTSNAWTIKLTPSFSIDTRQMELNGLAVKINWPTTGRDFIGNTEIRTPTGGVGTLSYTSSNTSVASVASNGKVTGQRNGTATITVRDASQSAVSYNVRVSNIFRLEHSAAIGQPGMNADQAFNWLNAVAGSIPLTSALPAMYEVYGSFLYWPGYPSDCIYWMCDASGCSGNSILWFVFARGGLQCHPNRYESKLAWCLRPL